MTWTLKNTGGKNAAKSPSVTVVVPAGLKVTKATSAKGSAKVLGKRSALFRPGSLGTDKDVKLELTATVESDPPKSVTAVGTATATNAVPAVHRLTVTPPGAPSSCGCPRASPRPTRSGWARKSSSRGR